MNFLRKPRLLLGACALAMALALPASAASPVYATRSDPGTAASPAEVIFPSSANQQIRLVLINWLSQTNNAVLSISGGEGAYAQTIASASSSAVTNVVSSNVGLVPGSTLVLERAGVGYPATLSSTNSGTNIVLAAGGWGVTAQAGDSIYQMGTPVVLPVGATTNWQTGEAIFVGNLGRPVRVVLTPALTTNCLNSVTARYE